MKFAFAAVVVVALGCTRGPSYQEFKEASGEFTADVPSTWHRDGHDDLRRRPTAVMTWIGEISAEKAGSQVGAMIHVTRFDRKTVPANFKQKTLDPTDAMFGSGPLPAGAPAIVTPLTLSGYPARRYRRDFEVVLGGGMHQAKGPYAMRLEDVVVQTPDAYFVLEYRATQELFNKHFPAFERLVSTFRIAQR